MALHLAFGWGFTAFFATGAFALGVGFGIVVVGIGRLLRRQCETLGTSACRGQQGRQGRQVEYKA